MAVTKSKKKVVKKVSHGIAHVVATNNNTRITITDQTGAVLTWATAGALRQDSGDPPTGPQSPARLPHDPGALPCPHC